MPDQKLAGTGLGNRRFLYPEIFGKGNAGQRPGEHDLVIIVLHRDGILT